MKHPFIMQFSLFVLSIVRALGNNIRIYTKVRVNT
jgi:hypothetical protein